METIQRKDLTDETSLEIIEAENHHDHEIIKDDTGTIRWKMNSDVRKVMDRNSMNDITILLELLGYGKNSEVYRKLYRDIGYSLSGYYEVFYWDVNNPECDQYKTNSLNDQA